MRYVQVVAWLLAGWGMTCQAANAAPGGDAGLRVEVRGSLALSDEAFDADGNPVRLAAVHDFEDVAVCPEPLRARSARRQARQQARDPGACLLLAEEDTPAIRAVSQQGGDLLGIVPLPENMRQRRPNRGPE